MLDEGAQRSASKVCMGLEGLGQGVDRVEAMNSIAVTLRRREDERRNITFGVLRHRKRQGTDRAGGESDEPALKRRRGRPPKVTIEAGVEGPGDDGESGQSAPKHARGRLPKAAAARETLDPGATAARGSLFSFVRSARMRGARDCDRNTNNCPVEVKMTAQVERDVRDGSITNPDSEPERISPDAKLMAWSSVV
ncbi:hypothetical protein B0H11DRAFT_1916962 [Mycena galericulata]|nr:hypothetical protein B0H11DRAFT_1916962 [Mycena galericulata]